MYKVPTLHICISHATYALCSTYEIQETARKLLISLPSILPRQPCKNIKRTCSLLTIPKRRIYRIKFPKISFSKTPLNLSIRNSATSNLFKDVFPSSGFAIHFYFSILDDI